jgi:hypothetical protein
MGLLDTLEKDYKAEEEFSVELPVASLPNGKMTLWFRGFKDVNERQAAAKKANGYSKAALVLGKARELGITGDNESISEQLAAVHLIHATFLRSEPEEEFSLQDAMRLLRLGEAFVLLKFQWEQGQKTVQSVMTQYFIDEAKKNSVTVDDSFSAD